MQSCTLEFIFLTESYYQLFVHFWLHCMLFSLLLLWMSCEQLRLLYECIPMAYIIEQAGGKATTGTMDILDIVPESIHQRTPIYMGSRDDIDDIMKIFKKHEQSQ